MTTWYRARFLFSSLGPLYLVLCAGLVVQYDWDKACVISYKTAAIAISAAMFLMSLAVFFGLQKGFASASPSYYQVKPLESLDEGVLSYMLSYIPPLMIDDLSSGAKITPVIVFYFVLILIMFRTESTHVNPYFLLFKYRIFKVELPSGRQVMIITRKSEINQNENLSLHEIQPAKLYFAS